MASTGKLSSSLNHLINTFNSQMQNNEINKASFQQNQQPILQQPIIACTAPVLDDSLNEISAKVATITISTTTDNNNNTTMTTPLVTVGGDISPLSRRKSSTSSYTNLVAQTTPTVTRPTNFRSTESSPEQATSTTQSINSSNLLSVSNSGMKTRRHSDNAINVPKIEIAPR